MMSFSNTKVSDELPEFNYHLLRNALNRYSRNLQQLEPQEYDQVYRSASKSFALECKVLESDEAGSFVVTPEQLDEALGEIAARYQSDEEFNADLQANGLDQDILRTALYRELVFDGVMQLIGSRAAQISDIDIRLFYEMHYEKFEQAEKRVARHILVTVNPDFEENTEQASLARIQQIEHKLGNRSNRFGKFARQYSECPTAMEEGKLGDVSRGQLYPQLDSLLFSMQENEISSVVESEMGFHLLWCEKIKPAKRVPLSLAEPRIREILDQRRRKNCQKTWLAELDNASPEC